jgi:hypothetical protein
MDGSRFRIEPWNGESENAGVGPTHRGRFVGEGPFLWFVSLTRACGARPSDRLRRSRLRRSGPAKEMNSRDSAKAFDLDLLSTDQSQKLSPEGELLSLLVQRK